MIVMMTVYADRILVFDIWSAGMHSKEQIRILYIRDWKFKSYRRILAVMI